MNEKILIFSGIIGGVIASMFGGWNESLSTLLLLIFVDYGSGFILSAVFKASPKTETGGLSSKIGWKGLTKKVLILVYIIIAQRLDIMMGTNYIKNGVCIAFICNELISITENSTLMGFPTPKFIINAIDILKQKSNEK